MVYSTRALTVGAMACKNPAAFPSSWLPKVTTAHPPGRVRSPRCTHYACTPPLRTTLQDRKEAFLVSKELKSFELKLTLDNPEIVRTVLGEH